MTSWEIIHFRGLFFSNFSRMPFLPEQRSRTRKNINTHKDTLSSSSFFTPLLFLPLLNDHAIPFLRFDYAHFAHLTVVEVLTFVQRFFRRRWSLSLLFVYTSCLTCVFAFNLFTYSFNLLLRAVCVPPVSCLCAHACACVCLCAFLKINYSHGCVASCV